MNIKMFYVLCFLFVSLQLVGQIKHQIKIGHPEPVPNNLGDTWICGFYEGDTIFSPSNDTKRILSVYPQV